MSEDPKDDDLVAQCDRDWAVFQAALREYFAEYLRRYMDQLDREIMYGCGTTTVSET